MPFIPFYAILFLSPFFIPPFFPLSLSKIFLVCVLGRIRNMIQDLDPNLAGKKKCPDPTGPGPSPWGKSLNNQLETGLMQWNNISSLQNIHKLWYVGTYVLERNSIYILILQKVPSYITLAYFSLYQNLTRSFLLGMFVWITLTRKCSRKEKKPK